jgi:hypothetical protein
MSRELSSPGPIGVRAYSLLFHDGYGVVWNTNTRIFEAPVASTWPSYTLPMTEQAGTGLYFGDMPSGIQRGTYSYIVKHQLSSTAAPTDPEIGQGSIEWDGFLPLSVAGQLDVNVGSRMVSFNPPNIDGSGRVVLQPTGLDQVMIAGKTLPQTVRYIAAICAGKVSGAGSGLEIFSDLSGLSAVQVSVDSSGNRTNVVLN